MQKIFIGLIGLLLVAGFGCSKKSEVVSPNISVVSSTPSAVTTTVKKPVIKKTTTQTSPTSPAKVLEYNEALKIYANNNYRLQIVSCSARPGSMIVKKGMKFMVDNRDDVARTIGIGSAKYYLGAYGWTVTSISSAGTFYVTCNGGGAGSITVQP